MQVCVFLFWVLLEELVYTNAPSSSNDQWGERTAPTPSRLGVTQA